MSSRFCFTFLTLLVAKVCWVNPSNAQIPPWDWSTGIGGAKTDGISKVVCRNGDVFISGGFESAYILLGSDSLVNTDTSSGDPFWAKLDQNGTYHWAKSGHGQFSEDGLALTVDSFGNVICAGNTASADFIIDNDTLHFAPGTAWNIYVAKFDQAGSLLWLKGFGGPSTEFARDLSTDDNGDIYLSGDFSSDTLFFGNRYVTNPDPGNDIDGFIAKLDSQGNGRWAKSIGGPNSDYPMDLTGVMGHSIAVTGYFAGDSVKLDSIVLYNHGSGMYDIFSAKYDTSGALLWAVAEGGTDDERAFSISGDASGNILTGGYSESDTVVFGSLVIPVHGQSDMLIMKYDAQGNRDTAWVNGGSGNDVINAVTIDNSDKSFYATGNFNSDTLMFDSIALINPGGSHQMFLAKYDSLDHIQWATILGGTGTVNGEFGSIAPDRSRNLYLAGYFLSPTISFGMSSLNNAGNNTSDGMLVKLDTMTMPYATHNIAPGNTFTVYPNPSHSNGTIQLSGISRGTIRMTLELFSVEGKLLYTKDLVDVAGNDVYIQLPGFAPGMYFLKMSTADASATEKIIIH